MTDCLKYEEMISAMVDGELSEDEQKSLYGHLAGCEGCAKLLAEFREQRSYFENQEKMIMPREIEASVMARTTRYEKRVGWPLRLTRGSYAIPKPVAWVTAVLVIVLAIFDLTRVIGGKSDLADGIISRINQQKIQKVVITDKDIVKTQTYSERNNL